MTVTNVTLTSWEGSESTSGLTYRQNYVVTTNDRNDGPSTVRNSIGIPFGSPFASGNDVDTRAFLHSSVERQLSSGTFHVWDVELLYSGTEWMSDPITAPVVESVAWNGIPRFTDKFFNGTAIRTTAGEPFQDKVEWTDNTPQPTYTINQASFNFALAQQTRNAVNLTAWKGFLPGTVKVASILSEKNYDFRIGIYYKVTYAFQVNPELWTSFIDSMGTIAWRYFTPAGKPAYWARVPITYQGVPTTVPVPLDANGVEIVPAYGGAIVTPAIVSGELYPRYDFNALFPFL